jgi:hypothetical protein
MAALQADATDTWLASLLRRKESTVSTEDLMSALDEARGELGDVV